MSLSPAQMRIVVQSGAFDAVLRRAIEAINASAPALARFAETLDRLKRSDEVAAHAARRHHARIVTRRKQRRSW